MTSDAASAWEACEMCWTTAAVVGVISRWCQPESCWAVQVPCHTGMLCWAQSHVMSSLTGELRRSPGCPARNSSCPPGLVGRLVLWARLKGSVQDLGQRTIWGVVPMQDSKVLFPVDLGGEGRSMGCCYLVWVLCFIIFSSPPIYWNIIDI